MRIDEQRAEAEELYPAVYGLMIGHQKSVCATVLAWILADICLIGVDETTARHDASLVSSAVLENIGKIALDRAPIAGNG